MPLFDGFLTESVFADSVTNSNLILFVLIREYLSAIDLDNPVFSDVKQADEKVKFYMFCYSLLRNAPTDPFDCLRQDSSVLPTRIRVLLRDRFSQLRNFFELVNYTHPSTVRGLFFSDVPLEDEDKFMLTKDSVFGLFLRRFSLGFHHQSFEQMTEFLNCFFEAYDVSIHSNTQENSMPCTSTESVGPASGCVFSKPAKPIADSFAKLTCHQNDHSTHWKQNYGDSKPLSLHLSVPRYTSLLHATQKRNLTQAEHDLCAYFETEMSRERSDSGPNNICAYMAVAAADMHLSFGNWYRGQSLEKEALRKTLESESKVPLSHLKITHRLLNPNSEPLRYDGQIGCHTVHRSVHTAFSELRTIFWDMLDSGAPPSRTLLLYFNTPIAMMPSFFSICLLDMATAWALYGYPVLHTALLQCVINADCLQPCLTSDSLLSIAFANMVKIFGDSGAIKEALHMNSVVANILHRSPEKMALRQAGLQVELEQALRSRADLAYCDRLVNALRLCCPWEATLFQAELERCRGNYNACCDLLRHITVSAEARIKCTSSLNNQFPSRSESAICPEPLSHLNLATFEDHVSVGGLVKIALIGLRAHLLLAEVFLSKGMCQKADKELNDAHCQAEKFRLSSGEAAILLLRQAVNVVLARSSQPVDSPTDQILSEILHRSDSCTRFRYSVFVSRLRLSYLSSDSDRLSFLKCHLQLLLNALEFHRSLDDRQQILLLLILLTAALHASGRIEERNRAVHALEELRSKHHLPICSARELAATLL